MILMRGLYKNNVILMINCHLKQGFEMLVYWYQYPLWCLFYEKKKKKKALNNFALSTTPFACSCSFCHCLTP